MEQTTREACTSAWFSVREWGAAGDGRTSDTGAIQAAIDACGGAGGGTVWFPAGAYVTGALFLRSNVTLHVDAGAALLGSREPGDYPPISSRWEGAERLTHAPLIGGRGLRNVSVTGRGTIDGRGQPWWQRQREKSLDYPRPRLISFVECSNVLIEGITATNSPSWTINPVRCENVTVSGVTIANPADSPNTDGINPDSCRNVHISNCHVDVGDDCITIKSGTEQENAGLRAPCENITVANCTMVHGHGGVVIGSEMSGGVRNVVIANCVFVGTDRGIRFKSRRGRGGLVEDVRVSNVVMTDVLCPLTMNLYYGPGAWGDAYVSDKAPHPVTEGTPRFRRIHLSHITARQVRYAAAFLCGLAEAPVEDVTVEDFLASMAPGAEAGYPDMADGLEPMGQAGFFVRNAAGLRLQNVEVAGQSGPALRIEDAADVEVAGCGSPTPDGPVVSLTNVRGAFVHGCQARAGTRAFLRVEGEGSREIALSGNYLARAAQPVEMANGAAADAVDGVGEGS